MPTCKDGTEGHARCVAETNQAATIFIGMLVKNLKGDSVINKDTLNCQLKIDSRNSRKSLNRLKN